jgi:hypothetical protein
MKRFIAALLLVTPVAAWAGLFDGTWKTNVSSVRVIGKPSVYLLQNGTYSCPACGPAITVPADGKPHKVAGHAYYDQIAVTVAGPRSVRISTTLAGRKSFERTLTVAADDKSLADEFTDYTAVKPAAATFAYKRVAPAPAGAHPLSGSWEPDVTNTTLSADLTLITYQQTADGLKMSTPTGQSYDAHFDGKEYATEGDVGKTMVTLKKLATNKIEETDRRRGKVTDVVTMEVSADGKTMHVVDHDRHSNQTITYSADKQ